MSSPALPLPLASPHNQPIRPTPSRPRREVRNLRREMRSLRPPATRNRKPPRQKRPPRPPPASNPRQAPASLSRLALQPSQISSAAGLLISSAGLQTGAPGERFLLTGVGDRLSCGRPRPHSLLALRNYGPAATIHINWKQRVMAAPGKILRLERASTAPLKPSALRMRAETPQEGEPPYPWPKLPKLVIAKR